MVVEEAQTDTSADARQNPHPLDPLSASEIQQAAALCRERNTSDKLRFVSIAL